MHERALQPLDRVGVDVIITSGASHICNFYPSIISRRVTHTHTLTQIKSGFFECE
jgi:hypothetical protein